MNLNFGFGSGPSLGGGAPSFDPSNLDFGGNDFGAPPASVDWSALGGGLPMSPGGGLDAGAFSMAPGTLTAPTFWDQLAQMGFGMNKGTLMGGLDALKSIGGLYLGMKQLGLAGDELNFMRSNANANLANQTQAYNTQIADRARSRAAVEGGGSAEANAYIAANSLKPRTV